MVRNFVRKSCQNFQNEAVNSKGVLKELFNRLAWCMTSVLMKAVKTNREHKRDVFVMYSIGLCRLKGPFQFYGCYEIIAFIFIWLSGFCDEMSAVRCFLDTFLSIKVASSSKFDSRIACSSSAFIFWKNIFENWRLATICNGPKHLKYLEYS